MDMGVIRNLKGHYRKKINERIIAELDADESKKSVEAIKNINLCDAICMWIEGKEQTVKNCFAKVGFRDSTGTDTQVEETLQLPDNLSPEEFEVIVSIDDNLEVWHLGRHRSRPGSF